MKTSNKILLGAFLTALLILISLHITIYAKYKNGDYTEVSDTMWMPNMATLSLDDVKVVAVDNIESVALHLSDSSKLQYEKAAEDEENMLTFTKKEDTLFVAGKSRRNKEGRWYKQTHLYLANGLPLKAINTNLHFEARPGMSASSFSLSMDHATIDIKNLGNAAAPLSSARIEAINRSHVYLEETAIRQLDVLLRDSYFEDKSLTTDSLTINTDTTSQIKLNGANLIKAKITTHE